MEEQSANVMLAPGELRPGSDQARARGCLCPPQQMVDDGFTAATPDERQHAYIVYRNCPLHYRPHASDFNHQRQGWRNMLPDWVPGHVQDNLFVRRAYEDDDEYRTALTFNDLNVAPPYMFHNDDYQPSLVATAPSAPDTSTSPVQSDSGFHLPSFSVPQIDIPSPDTMARSLTDTLDNAANAISTLGDTSPWSSTTDSGGGGGSGSFTADTSSTAYGTFDSSSTSSTDYGSTSSSLDSSFSSPSIDTSSYSA